MAFKLYSDVRETSLTGGTGDQVLTGQAFDGTYARFNDRYSDGDTFFYCMRQGAAREIGLGMRVASGDKVSRTKVYQSTNSGNLVNFTNGQTVDIFVTNIAPQDMDEAGKALLRTAIGSQPGVRTVTGTDTIVASDYGKALLFNSATAFSLAVTAAATLGNGFWCRFKNIGSGAVTIDPSSSETIDGLTTIIAPKNDSGMIVCDGTAFQTLERPAVVLLGSGSLSSANTVNLPIPAGFATIEVFLNDLKPSTASFAECRISADGGSTYATGYDYAYTYQGVDAPGTVSAGGSTSQTYMILSGTHDIGSPGMNMHLRMQNLTSNASYFKLRFDSMFSSSGSRRLITGHNWLGNGAVYNLLQLFPSAGNWASGDWQFYGLRKIN